MKRTILFRNDNLYLYSKNMTLAVRRDSSNIKLYFHPSKFLYDEYRLSPPLFLVDDETMIHQERG